MRKLILKMSMTLDGFVGGPNGEASWVFKTEGVFTQKGFSGADPKLTTHAVKDALKNREQKGDKVSSHAAGAESWAHPRVFAGDMAQAIQKLKQEPGKDIVAHGGAGFARSLAHIYRPA